MKQRSDLLFLAVMGEFGYLRLGQHAIIKGKVAEADAVITEFDYISTRKGGRRYVCCNKGAVDINLPFARRVVIGKGQIVPRVVIERSNATCISVPAEPAPGLPRPNTQLPFVPSPM
jgi:hypothetical protein